MADDNVIRATTQLDTSGLASGGARAEAIVEQTTATIKAQYRAAEAVVREASANMAQAAAAFGPAAAAGNEVAQAALKQYEAELATAKVAQAELAAGMDQVAASSEKAATGINTAGLGLRGFFIIYEAGRLGFKAGELVADWLDIADSIKEATRAMEAMNSATDKALERTHELQVQALRDEGKLADAAQLTAKYNHDKLISIPQPDPEKLKQLPDKDVQGILDATTTLQGGDLPARIAKVKQDLADARANYEAMLKPPPVSGANPAEALGTALNRGRAAKQADEVISLYDATLRVLTAKQQEFDAQQITDAAALARAKVDEAKKTSEAQKQAYSGSESAARKADADAMEELKARGGTFAQERALLQSEIAEQSRYTDVIRTLKGELNRVNDEAAAHMESGIRKLDEQTRKQAESYKKQETDMLEYLERFVRETDEEERVRAEAAKKEEEQAARVAAIRARAQTEIAEVGAKGAGESADLAIQQKKLQLEQQYALQIGHTNAQQVAELRAIAALDEQSREAKIAGLEAEKGIAQAALNIAKAKELAHESDAADLKAVQDQAAAMKRIAELQQQINQLTQQNVNAGIQATTKTIDVEMQRYQQFFNQLNAGFTHAFNSMIQGQKNWKQQFQDVLKQMETSFFSTILLMTEKYIEQQIAQTLAHSTAVAAQTAVTAAGAKAGLLIQLKTQELAIFADAKTAAANTYAALSAIPVIGPVIAPIGAAAAFVAVEAFGNLGALETGTNYVPKTGPYTLHEGERVTPKKYNPNAGGSGSGGHSFHYHAAPGASSSETKADMATSFAHFKRQARAFNR